jgi:hypothetical protein
MPDQEPDTQARRCALTGPSPLAFLPMVRGSVYESAREGGFQGAELAMGARDEAPRDLPAHVHGNDVQADR